MKWLFIILMPGILLVFTCIFSTDPIQGGNYMEYFPLGDNYSWKYEVKTSTFKNNTLTSTSTDTVYYSLKLDSIANYSFYYSFFEEDRIIDRYLDQGDTVYSLVHPTSSNTDKCIFWKNNFKINQEWKSFRLTYAGPRIFYEILHRPISLNATLQSKDKEYKHCVLLEREYIAIAGYKEKVYYSKGLGLVAIEGTSNLLDYETRYRQELLEFYK